MQVILLEKVRNLGNLGDKVNVKPGYGRNFLIPEGKAVFATKDNVVIFEERRADLEAKAQQLLTEAEARAAKINETTVEIAAQASDEGKLFGSVSINEVREALKEKAIDVQKREIAMPEGPIHSIGEYQVHILLHTDVIANLKVNVVAAK